MHIDAVFIDTEEFDVGYSSHSEGFVDFDSVKVFYSQLSSRQSLWKCQGRRRRESTRVGFGVGESENLCQGIKSQSVKLFFGYKDNSTCTIRQRGRVGGRDRTAFGIREEDWG